MKFQFNIYKSILISYFAALPFLMLGQNIDSIKYFIDVDPGLSNGYLVSGIPISTDISNQNFSVDIAALTTGFHTLYTRSFSGGISSKTEAFSFVKVSDNASNIVYAEYFWNTDPGRGNGVSLPISVANNVSNLPFSVDVTLLENGFNSLFIRSKDTAGKWSNVNLSSFYKIASSSLSNISKYEYFIDQDPGLGNGSAVNVVLNTDVMNTMIPINTSSISNGIHQLFVRSKSIDGIWSFANLVSFFKIEEPNLNKVKYLEYYTDVDPGKGNGTAVTISSSSNVTNIAFDTGYLTEGFHTVYIRSRDSLYNWSLSNKHTFVVVANKVEKLKALEYFFDADPGVGNGTVVPFSPPSHLPNLVLNLDVTALGLGFHKLFLRSIDSMSKTSIVNQQSFYKVEASTTMINQAEYFLDVDPGIGNGIQVAIVPNENKSNVTIPINTSINNGFHILYCRSKDDLGRWALASKILFYKEENSLGNIDRMEYFIDIDPGNGNATALPITPNIDVSNFGFAVNLSNVSEGFHHIYIRSKDDWSMVNQALFYKMSSASKIVKLEYFINSDPGRGNGVNVPITQSQNIEDLNFTINLAGYPMGIHRLYVRSLDSLGNWSLCALKQFDVSSALPLNWLAFDVDKLSNNHVTLEWKTLDEINVSHFEVERSKDDKEFYFLSEMKAANQAANTYNAIDKSPLIGMNYYRIKQIDYDGQFTHSPIKAVHIETEGIKVEVLNSPSAQPEIRVSKDLDYYIFTADGKKIKEGNIAKDQIFTLHNYQNGTYFIAFAQEARMIKTVTVTVVQ